MQNIVSKACAELDIQAVPSRRVAILPYKTACNSIFISLDVLMNIPNDTAVCILDAVDG